MVMSQISSAKADEEAKGKQRPAPLLEGVSLLSNITYSWAEPLLELGKSKILAEEDLAELSGQDKSAFNLNFMQNLYNESKKNGKNTKNYLHRALVLDFIKSVWFIQPQYVIESAAKIIQAISLGKLIDSFGSANNDVDDEAKGFIWAGILFFCGCILLVTHHQIFFYGWRRGMQYRLAAIAAIYNKSLRLPTNSSISNGMVMNLASNDVERFIMASLFISYLVWGPIEAIAVLIIGIQILGSAFAFGCLLLGFIFPLQFFLSKQFVKFRQKISAITDKRVNLLSQAVTGVRVMKISGWELSFEQRIKDIRNDEMRQIQRASRLKAMNEAIFFCCNIVIATFVLVLHVVVLDGDISSGKVFTTISLLSLIQFTMGKFFAFGIMSTSECSVSVRRLENLLSAPELAPVDMSLTKSQSDENDPNRVALSFSNVTCFWNDDWRENVALSSSNTDSGTDIEDKESAPTSVVALDSLSFEYRMDELLCIIGPVGCGKSALLLAIAGELSASSGTIHRNYASLAYACQDPWIMDGTVRENITMGRTFDQIWYNKIVKACGLDIDFTQFSDADMTIVGDRGVQLSGGQRARLGLARALYIDADVLLLDDPLSAVDAKVGRLIYNSAIQGLRCQRGKGVILVTHQHQFLGNSRCLFILGGKLKCDGTYKECITASDGILSVVVQDEEESGRKGILKSNIKGGESDDEIAGDSKAFKEQSSSGIVSKSTYIGYGKALGGTKVIIFLLFLFSAAQASALFAIRNMGEWAESSNPSATSEYIAVIGYCALTVFLSVAMALTSLYFMLRASQHLHDDMTNCVLRAKVSFFDTNPLGRILNRFSADVGIIDDLLPTTLYDFLVTAFYVLGGLAAAAFALPFILLAIPPLAWYFISLRNVFLATSREAKRLEGMARSPIFSMLSESLLGISTIRSCDSVNYFQKKFQEAQDAHTRAFFSFIAASRWLGIRLDSIVVIFLGIAAFLTVCAKYFDWFETEPATLGLALLMIIQLSGTFQWCVRQSAEVVNHMVSTERILAFSKLPSEAALHTIEESKNHSKWPANGAVRFENVRVRYRPELSPALDAVSFSVNARERIGVVGRTGSGKSTLIQALFRLLESEEGHIFVDDVDISMLGLHNVRNSLSCIPQYPVLFSGCTVRENLDPFMRYDDVSIFDALKSSQMYHTVMALSEGLDTPVAEGGSNFSVGQRQLLCLARAILRKNKILVLDEPTANVDGRTDELLQNAISESFNDSTIIAVAHRLDTIINYDKILVLGNGRVLEFGAPHELIENDGHFASMVADTGEGMATQLRQKAMQRKIDQSHG